MSRDRHLGVKGPGAGMQGQKHRPFGEDRSLNNKVGDFVQKARGVM